MNKLKNAAIKVTCEEQKRYEKEKEEINDTSYWDIYWSICLIVFIILLLPLGLWAIYVATSLIDFLTLLLMNLMVLTLIPTFVFAFIVYKIGKSEQLSKERKIEKKYVRNINTSLSTYQNIRDILNKVLKEGYYIKNFIILDNNNFSNFDHFVIISYFDYQNKNSFIVLGLNETGWWSKAQYRAGWWKPRQNKFESEPSIFKSKKHKDRLKDRLDDKNLKRLYYLFEKHLEN